MKRALLTLLAVSGLALSATTASAYTLNDDGTGFVGKGEVQSALGLNNNQLQNGTFAFTHVSTEATVSTWTCDRDGGNQTQERANTVTTTVQGVVSATERTRNQITGFTLTGFDAGAVETEVETDGPAVGSCPTFWTAIDLVQSVESSTGGLYVNGVLLP